VGEPVDERGIAVEGEDHRLVLREEDVEVRVEEPVGVGLGDWSIMRSTTLTTRTLRSGAFRRSRSTSASVSSVGTSPEQAMTTSGSPPWSMLAQSQGPLPAGQCRIACSMVSHCGADCLPATTTLM
jgi:hypothetical protein